MYYVTGHGAKHPFRHAVYQPGVIGMMFGSMLAKVLTDRWCKLKVFFWTNIALAIFSCAFYFFDPKATTTIVVLYVLLNILHQIPSPLHWSLMADVDDYGEWKTGKRITGISFSGNIFFLKLGLAIAGAMVGFLLSVRLRCGRKSAERGCHQRDRAALYRHSRHWILNYRGRSTSAESGP